jgi:hypothetical protein
MQFQAIWCLLAKMYAKPLNMTGFSSETPSEGRQSCKKLQHMLEQKLQKLQKLQKIKVTQKEVPQIYVKNVQKKYKKKCGECTLACGHAIGEISNCARVATWVLPMQQAFGL